MPILYTNHRTGTSTTHFANRVVAVREYEATRNWSDTMDYTDYRLTACVDAVVYLGRRGVDGGSFYRLDMLNGNASDYVRAMPVVDLPIRERFAVVDCTNLFVWRGSEEAAPSVDVEALATDTEMAEDWAAYQDAMEADAVAAKEAAAKREAARIEEERRREEDRVVVGKPMLVARGRKVKVGTAGTVAYMREGRYGWSALLKPDGAWRDRAVDGVWVDARNLSARRPCTKHSDCVENPDIGATCAAQSMTLL